MPAEDTANDRTSLIAPAVRTWESHSVTAVHLFGSLARGNDDSLSDIDLWVTVPDGEIAQLIEQRHPARSSLACRQSVAAARPLGPRHERTRHR
jgi:predicted nucleotidyltransferase